MQARVGNLYFAGEATDAAFNGYVHGAYNSGKVVAQMVLDDLQHDEAASKILAAKADDEEDEDVANGEHLKYSSTRRNLHPKEEEEAEEDEEEDEGEERARSGVKSTRLGGTIVHNVHRGQSVNLDAELDAELLELETFN